jgi:hypothetical protein
VFKNLDFAPYAKESFETVRQTGSREVIAIVPANSHTNHLKRQSRIAP